MKSFNFWLNWLRTLSVIFAIFGLSLAAFNQTYFFNIIFNDNINPVFFGETISGIGVIRFQQWIYGILGSASLFIGILLYCIVSNAYKKKERWARSAILLSIIGWFILNEFVSLYFNVYFNVISNICVLVAVLLPIIFTSKYFKKQQND